MRKNLIIVLLVVSAAVAVAAGLLLKQHGSYPVQDNKTDSNHQNAGPRKSGPIAVIPKGTTHSFWKSVLAGAQDAAKENSVNIFWTGPDREGDREKQIQIVEDFIVRKVAGIVLAPTDSRALVPVVERAQLAKIPVVIIDSDIETDARVSLVATDNYQAGALAAHHMAKLLGAKGNVAVIKYMPGSASTTAREKGFIETLRNEYPAVNIVEDRYGLDTVETALSAAEDVLTHHKHLDGIFACNESTSVGTLRALESQGRGDSMKMIGFDAADALIKALESGRISALVVQNPYAMGYKGVSCLVSAIKGQPVPQRIDTGVRLVTKDMLKSKDVRSLIGKDS